MIFANSHTSSILRKPAESKRQTLEQTEAVQSLMDRREMRLKKLDFESKMHSSEALTDKEKEIKNLLDQHSRVDLKIIDHYKRETSQQEDLFQRKMRERKDRSVERSMSKSVDMGTRRKEKTKAFQEVEAAGAGGAAGWKGIESQILTNSILTPRDSNLLTQKPAEGGEAQGGRISAKPDDLGKLLTESAAPPNEKMDAFSAKKMNALNAKMNKMKQFEEAFAAQK